MCVNMCVFVYVYYTAPKTQIHDYILMCDRSTHRITKCDSITDSRSF